MIMVKKIFAIALLLMASCQLSLAADGHFITDGAYRGKVETAFKQKMDLVGKKFFATKGLKTTEAENEALEFLYAYMPVADVTDYTTAFYLQNVRTSFETRKEMEWGSKVPELLFRHFVLPLRVNNENLDDSREVFYKELKDRVKGLSMYDAILEVNHWCHEKVVYLPTDARTLSPLATVQCAYGRCGEQSTFTVAALRAVGIPARQVYTPRWAHTDDNHAWVEAWADGKWYFFGACEPEAVLNLGWFNAPASRALLMHTDVFGDYNGPEEVMQRTAYSTTINLINNYGSSSSTDFVVVDSQGKRVKGARVDFKIYNYGEFYSAVIKYTDAEGKTSLMAGKGDMLVWASKDGKYGVAKASFGKDQIVTVRLNHDARRFTAYKDSFDIVPPPEKVILPTMTDEQRAKNLERLAYEDSVRHAYLATFLTKETACKVAEENGLPADKVADLLVTSTGNHAVILQFLVEHKDNLDRAVSLLSSLSGKDLKDMPLAILNDNFNATSDQLCPRVENEMIIRPFKQFFEKAFSKKQADKFRQDPAQLVAWVKENIRINSDKKVKAFAQTPVGVWESRFTDNRSRKIFFVDVARSLGIEAQVDPVTKKPQYKKNGQWVDVDFESATQNASATGTLKIAYHNEKAVDNPKYYSHFTVSRLNDDGTISLLEFNEGEVDMGGGVSWASTFKDGVSLDAGNYVLVTGTRLANGGVLSSVQTFSVEAGKTTTVDMQLRASQGDVTVIGNFDSEAKFRKMDGSEVSILSQTGRGYFIMGLIGVGQEPTNHALRDIAKVAKTFEDWNRPMLLLFEDEAAAKKFKADQFPGLPKNIIFGIDKDGAIRKQMVENMKLANATLLPIFSISDTFNRVVYISQGYTIGLGEQMETVMKKL